MKKLRPVREKMDGKVFTSAIVPRNNEGNLKEVSEQFDGRVATKVYHGFSRTKSRILGAPSKLDEALSNEQLRTPSGTVPTTSRNTV